MSEQDCYDCGREAYRTDRFDYSNRERYEAGAYGYGSECDRDFAHGWGDERRAEERREQELAEQEAFEKSEMERREWEAFQSQFPEEQP